MSHMFQECNSLKEIRDVSNVNNYNDKTIGLSYFDDDSSFKEDPQQNIINEGEEENSFYMFNEDNKIPQSISTISNKFNFDNFDTNNRDNLVINLQFNNIKDMSNMFDGCSSLISLPNISKWNTSKVIDMSYMFGGCSSLI